MGAVPVTVSSATNVAALKLVPVPPRGVYLAHNACYNCNHNKDLIVFPTLIETEGQLALCTRCIRRAAKLIGLVQPGKLAGDLKMAQDELEMAHRTLNDQNTIIAAYEAMSAARERLSASRALTPTDQDVQLPGMEEGPDQHRTLSG